MLTTDDHDYTVYQQRLFNRLASFDGPLFTTNATGLYEAFLGGLPHSRQHYTCRCCHTFMSRYGGLAIIDPDGRTRPAMWDESEATEFFRGSAKKLASIVSAAFVTGVFLTKDEVLGNPVTGQWTHFATQSPRACRHNELLLTAGQAMAEKREDFLVVGRTMEKYKKSTFEQAVRLLESNAMYRSEKVLGPAVFLKRLYEARERRDDKRRDNVTWLAVATASSGLTRSSMVDTLLEDIEGGEFDFDDISRRFAAKMDPSLYQRAQVAPTAGNIQAAENAVEKMGIARSLERRFARLDEIEAVWRPVATTKGSGGVFGHLQPKTDASPAPLFLPAETMTWEKFSRTVLPNATDLECLVPYRGNFTALLTAEHQDAPPIYQWDSADRRNPVSYYVYKGGSVAARWGLTSNVFRRVNAVSLSPCKWGPNPDAFPQYPKGTFLILDGAKDTIEAGNGLFKEDLISELHAIRSTVERYSASAKLGGRNEASACGLLLTKGQPWDQRVRAKVNGSWREYILDRWD